MLHPLLGPFALVAVAILIALALVNQWSSRMVLAEAHRGLCHVNGLSDKIRTETDMSQSMGMHQATYTRWQGAAKRRCIDTTGGRQSGWHFWGGHKNPPHVLAICHLGAQVPILFCRLPCPWAP